MFLYKKIFFNISSKNVLKNETYFQVTGLSYLYVWISIYVQTTWLQLALYVPVAEMKISCEQTGSDAGTCPQCSTTQWLKGKHKEMGCFSPR